MSSREYFALTFICDDRPGIVMEVSKVLYESKFNIEDSSSTLLMGVFSMILIVSVENGYTPLKVKKSFAHLINRFNMSISVRKLKTLKRVPQKETFIISIYGADHPGIVYNITKALAEREINIIDLQTKVTGNIDTPVYVMVLEVVLPEGGIDNMWQEHLKDTARKIGTDINIRQVESYEL
mgnify:CR=1 FL=1